MTLPILIAGFGPAGAALALALHRAGMPTDALAIADPAAAAELPSRGPDSRILALNAGSCRLLSMLGVWPQLAAEAHPMRAIALTDSALDAAIRPTSLGFEMPDAGEPLAHLVPLGRLQAVLREAVRQAGIPVLAEAIRSLRAEPDRMRVTTNDREREISLLVAADGARSIVRRIAGISVHGWAYGQVAITAIVTHSGEHRGEAIQHFLPSGPFALLPLDEHRSSMVWSESTSAARRLLALPEADLRAEIDRRAAGWRGRIEAVGAISSHPLSLGIARRFIGDRLALVADAAHVVHPLAGQGLNLGFADVAMLAELIVERLRVGLDPGDPGMLETYQARRRPPTMAMAAVTEGINRLFSNDFAPLRLIRDAGLQMVGRSEALRGFFQRQAAGGDFDAPKLFRGEAL